MIENVVVKDKANNSVYLDLMSKLLEKGIVVINGPISDEMAFVITAQLTWLSTNSELPIQLWVTSPGGSVSAGLQIIDTMNWIAKEKPITTVVQGMAASMGAMIAMCGSERKAFKHARIMIHETSFGFNGKSSDVDIMYEENKKILNILVKMISEKTKLGTEKEIRDLIKFDRWYDTKEALKVGLIDSTV